MEHSVRCETDSCSSCQILHLLWHPKVQCRVHKIPLLGPILSCMNPTHIFTPELSKIHGNFVAQSTSGSPKWSLPSRCHCIYFSSLSCVLHVPLQFCLINLNLHTYFTELSPWSRALLEKSPVVQLLKNFPKFYEVRRFITEFIRALY
jgi:hypothetical protein